MEDIMADIMADIMVVGIIHGILGTAMGMVDLDTGTAGVAVTIPVGAGPVVAIMQMVVGAMAITTMVNKTVQGNVVFPTPSGMVQIIQKVVCTPVQVRSTARFWEEASMLPQPDYSQRMALFRESDREWVELVRQEPGSLQPGRLQYCSKVRDPATCREPGSTEVKPSQIFVAQAPTTFKAVVPLTRIIYPPDLFLQEGIIPQPTTGQG